MPRYQGLFSALILAAFVAAPAAAERPWRESDSIRTRRALALVDPGQCGGAHRLCRHFYLQGRFSKAFFTGSPEAAPACEAMLASEGGAIPADLGAKACAALIRKDIPGACALLRGGVTESAEFTLKTCEDDFRMFLGEDGACRNIPGDARGLCRGIAALRRIGTPGGEDACLREPWCRALQGGKKRRKTP